MAPTVKIHDLPHEERVQHALQYLQNNPQAKLTAVAEKFFVGRKRLRNRSTGIGANTTKRPVNYKLSEVQEQALLEVIRQSDSIGLLIRQKATPLYANEILKHDH